MTEAAFIPLIKWPYPEDGKLGELMTKDAVWSAYVFEHRRRIWLESELAILEKRIHNQRAEIKRLAASREGSE